MVKFSRNQYFILAIMAFVSLIGFLVMESIQNGVFSSTQLLALFVSLVGWLAKVKEGS